MDDMQKYSVLMSVYYKEKAENLRASIQSVFRQSCNTDDFVLVCDGPLGDELNAVIVEAEKKFGSFLNVIRLDKNQGLGRALDIGLSYCKNELVARMDSDDISFPERCEKQVKLFMKDSALDIVSATVLEFSESTKEICGMRKLPEKHDEICVYSRKRNPFNHPVIMFRKTAVENAGGYSEKYPFFEDYYLWIMMLRNGCIGYNIQQPLLYMRVSDDMYMRRGGVRYAKVMLKFHNWLRNIGWISWWDYISGALVHAIVCIMPNCCRRGIYIMLHKKKY